MPHPLPPFDLQFSIAFCSDSTLVRMSVEVPSTPPPSATLPHARSKRSSRDDVAPTLGSGFTLWHPDNRHHAIKSNIDRHTRWGYAACVRSSAVYESVAGYRRCFLVMFILVRVYWCQNVVKIFSSKIARYDTEIGAGSVASAFCASYRMTSDCTYRAAADIGRGVPAASPCVRCLLSHTCFRPP